MRQQDHEARHGHDAGPATIAYHLAKRIKDPPSRTTIWPVLKREGLIVAQPPKRPICSRIRFEAQLPNEIWQTYFTAWALADGEVAEILDLVDDHSRLLLGCYEYARVKAADVVESFHRAAELHDLPSRCSVATRLSSSAPTAGARCSSSQGWSAWACASRTRAPISCTPLQAYSARVKASPAGTASARYFRVRQDKVDKTGRVSLRYDSRLYKIGLGRAHKGREVKLLVADRDIRVIDSCSVSPVLAS